MTEIFLASLLLGAISGLLAGLFGIGGGLIIVPILLSLFDLFAVIPEHLIMITAIATSLATIVFTSISSILAHYRQHNILWHRVWRLTPNILIGAALGAILANKMNAELLGFIFIAYLLYVGLQMAFQFKPSFGEITENKWLDYSVSFVIGLMSSLLGIGGGTLTVPFLVSCNTPMKNAVAISSVCGLPIAIAASSSYIFLGSQQQDLPLESFGYIYLPAFFGIVCCSILTAPLGAKLASKLPAAQLKRYFSMMLFVMAGKMLWSLTDFNF